MSFNFSFNHSDEGDSIVLIGTKGVRIISDSHANFNSIKSNLLSDTDLGFSAADMEAMVYDLADAGTKVAATLRRLSDRVLLKGDTIYFDGDEMENRFTKHLVEMVKGGDGNWAGYVAFLENLQANPAKESRKGLFKFLDRSGLVVTADGCFLAYKAIGTNGKSVTAGNEDVTVTLEDGTVETHKGHIPNPVGAVVEMPRSLVTFDRSVACSVGLHVGTHEYASSFAPGGGFLTVKVNPRDVVSVPSGSNDQKVRTCRYEVLEVNEGRAKYEGTSYVEDDDDDDIADGESWAEDADEDWCAVCEEWGDPDEHSYCCD